MRESWGIRGHWKDVSVTSSVVLDLVRIEEENPCWDRRFRKVDKEFMNKISN